MTTTVDNLSKERRSWNMGQIRSGDTAPEMSVRSVLHRMGFRFRVHVKGLPGKPDIVLSKWEHIIFVHGCFWHRHAGCKLAYTPKTRIKFWKEKFRQNRLRDETVVHELRKMGWEVSIVWECETMDKEELVRKLEKAIKG